jgi:hypothetical protein
MNDKPTTLARNEWVGGCMRCRPDANGREHPMGRIVVFYLGNFQARLCEGHATQLIGEFGVTGADIRPRRPDVEHVVAASSTAIRRAFYEPDNR